MPRTTKDAVYKARPQLREGRLDALAQTTDECAPPPRFLWRNQEQFRFFSQRARQRSASITAITQHDAAINCLRKCSCHISLIGVARSQHTAQDFSTMRRDEVQFETEEPSGRRFPKIRSIFSQETHSPVTDWFADRNRLGVHQIERRGVEVAAACGCDQLPNQRTHQMQTTEPLFVGAQVRKGRSPVVANEQVSLLERGAFKRTLQKRNGEHLGIREGRLAGRRTAPLRALWMRFEIIINKAVVYGHLMLYAAHRSSSFVRGRSCVATSFYTPAKC